jgi:predicted nucleotidyltransferase
MFQLKAKMNPTGFPPVAKTLPPAVESIVSKLKPEKIILFGSYAYGKPTHDSDVDLLVIMKTRKKRQVDRYLAVSRLLHPRQFPVDIIVKTPKEIQDALKGGVSNGFFIREILERGKVLYDRHK